MKCKLNETKRMLILLAVGLVLALAGFGAAKLLGEEQNMLMRIAGLVSGLGSSLAAIGGGVLLWRRIVGKRRARESELSMNDERGQMIAYKAQGMTAIAAVLALVAMLIAAVVRGDRFYMLLGSALCMAVAAVKLGLLWFYVRKM